MLVYFQRRRTLNMACAQPKMTIAEKLEKALEFKDVGNSAYKEGNFKVAAKNYHRAILYLKVRAGF